MEIQTRLGKHLLILIDDTDKMPPEKGLDVFYDNGHHLAAPKTNIVYVIDIALSTHTRYAAIQGKFSGSEFFPAIKVVERDGKTPAAGRNVLLELAKKRLSEEGSYDEAALESAIEYSGGVVRELIRILQYAVFNAKGTIHTSNIDTACHRIANGFNLFGKHNFILRWVLEDPDWLAKAKDEVNESTLLDLLHMPALFQYRNGEIKWYRPYPVLIDWLKRLYPKPPELPRQGPER